MVNLDVMGAGESRVLPWRIVLLAYWTIPCFMVHRFRVPGVAFALFFVVCSPSSNKMHDSFRFVPFFRTSSFLSAFLTWCGILVVKYFPAQLGVEHPVVVSSWCRCPNG